MNPPHCRAGAKIFDGGDVVVEVIMGYISEEVEVNLVKKSPSALLEYLGHKF